MKVASAVDLAHAARGLQRLQSRLVPVGIDLIKED